MMSIIRAFRPSFPANWGAHSYICIIQVMADMALRQESGVSHWTQFLLFKSSLQMEQL